MNKRAGVGILLKFIIGLIIAIGFIYLLLTVADKFLLFGKEKIDQQKVFFDKLNDEIEEVNINGEISQHFQLKQNYLLIAFNNKDTEVNLKDTEIYSGYKIDAKTTVKKPVECTNCLCLCKTKNKKIISEDDCLQPNDICEDYEEEIINNDKPFFLFGEVLKNLKIKKTFNKIDITF